MQAKLQSRHVPLLDLEGLRFKDHNRNGQLDPYEDWRLPASERASDLVARMSLAEKAGAMMHANPPSSASSALPGAGVAWSFPEVSEMVLGRHITAFLNRLNTGVREMAEQHNRLQAIAGQGRLGIPALLSSDPRNQFTASQGVSVAAGAFTQWPDPAGLAAVGDEDLVRRYATSVRQEYRAVGIRMALSPMADLAIHPRWHRGSGCFGNEPQLAARLVRAYVEGMQAGDRGLTPESVVSVVKHWVGYGATQADGFDAHNHYGRHMGATSADIESHIIPFTGAFAAAVGCVMPAYSLPPAGLTVQGTPGEIERVGVGFNRQLLTDILRHRFGFAGVVMSDWHITDDCSRACIEGAPPGCAPGPQDIAMPWGAEHLSKTERFAKSVLAGVDQFGGAQEPGWIIDAVRQGLLPVAAIDQAVHRIMTQRFALGLFEEPYVDEEAAASLVGDEAAQALSLEAQRRSLVLLQNRGGTLPLRGRPRLYLHQIDADLARRYGFEVTERPEEADLAIVGLTTPHEVLHPQHFFGRRYREGDTGFSEVDPTYQSFRQIAACVPTVVSIYLERPADLTRIAPWASAIVAHFGLRPQALFDVLTGRHAPMGRLPFDLPWSGRRPETTEMATCRGHGLRYG
jgi:beta-glucosidase